MKKRLIAIMLSLALVISSQSVFAATGFSDLTEFHSWAEPYIEKMTTIGIIKGYTDGTFRPDRAITKTEALVLIARAAGYVSENYETFTSAAYARYAKTVIAYNTPYPNEAAYLLYKGILTEEELGGYLGTDRAGSALLRYEMAELLTKLMRADSELRKYEDITLSYADSGEIPYTSAVYVDFVTRTGLMKGVYDSQQPTKLFFQPYESVTRAQMAVMLSRVLSSFEISVSYAKVIGNNSSANTLTYRDNLDKTVIFNLNGVDNLIIDGYKTEDISYARTGASVAFFYINNALADVEIVNTAENKWDGVEEDVISNVVPTTPVEGTISTLIFSDECRIIVDNVEYTLASASSIYVNHIASTIYDLRVGHSVNLEFSNGMVIKVDATTASTGPSSNLLTAEGFITKISLTNRYINLNVTNAAGETNERQLFIETGAVIVNSISGQSIDFASLELDDKITATGTLKNGEFHASKIIVE